MQTSKQGLPKGYHLSIEGIWKEHLFPEKPSPCVGLWGIWNGFWGGCRCHRNIMLHGRLIYRLKLSHKSLCHWLLCFDCILLVRWWCQDRTINNKQILDEVFVISGIIKIEISVISRFKGRVWYYLPRAWLFRISEKPNLTIVLLYIVLKKITTNIPSQGT